MISSVLDENIRLVEEAFKDCGDFVKRKLPIGRNKDIWLYVAYMDMLVSRDTLEGQVLDHLMIFLWENPPREENLKEHLFETLKDGVTTADIQVSEDMGEIREAILSGDTVIFVDGCARAMLVSTKGWPSRGVSATDSEVVVQGSKDAFTESFRVNTTLVRRRIKDSKLKVKQFKVGKRTLTSVGLMYLEDVVRKDVLRDAESRIESIDIDAILDSGYIAQLIEDDWKSPFPQSQVTERPDKASAAILEGRIVVVVDNSPFVLIIPATMNTFFQASDDYYQNWEIMSFARLIRFAAGFMAASLPGLYIAIACFHPSMIPMLLIFKMAGARQAVPFPAVAEMLLMDLAFELLREAGIRLPGPIGHAIGIVGGLIIGQAAVEAGLVSPIVVIIVALSGMSSFAIPHVSLVAGFRLTKYLLLACSAVLGLFGFWMGALFTLIHLATLKSFGLPYLFPFVSGDINCYSDMKDTLFRVPLFAMKKRPIFANPSESVRIGPHDARVKE
ncbi:MAG: spore germination protein [Clostridiales bacterium]|jgi:spore germination protein|nr:spore germination protein [Clostridiales bacterium]